MQTSLEAQLETQQSSRSPGETLNNVYEVLRSLSPKSAVLASVIGENRYHLTFEQFQSLLKDPYLKDSILELRDKGLFVPLEGRSHSGKRIPVYYFPSKISEVIRAALLLLPEVDRSLRSTVVAHLQAVGYEFK